MVVADFNDTLLPVSMAKMREGREFRHHTSSSNSFEAQTAMSALIVLANPQNRHSLPKTMYANNKAGLRPKAVAEFVIQWLEAADCEEVAWYQDPTWT